MPDPGDIVLHEGSDHVVVDVTGDGYAILRRPDDQAGEHLTAAPADQLTAIGRA